MSRIARLLADPDVHLLHSKLADASSQIVDQAIAVQQIAAPTFHERQRAEYVHTQFKQFGLHDLEIDEVHNVYGRLPGTDPALPALLIAAHLDTVFSAETPLKIDRVDGKVYGPGLGDNSMGVAGLLTLVELLRHLRLGPDIWFVANSCEEGMGDLRGIRAAFGKLRARLGMALIVEGMAFGHIYHGGIAVRRLEISTRTGGGHSWLHFGRPSAIHSLMQIGAAISALSVPENPRTTFNIGVIEGGQSVNTIASTASLLLDMRSVERESLLHLEQQVLAVVKKYQHSEMEVIVKVVGDRPSGSIPVTHPLVELARDISQHVGVIPTFEVGSTDANVPLAAGLPTITVGITNGGNAHRTDEYIEISPIKSGLWHLILLAVAAAKGYARL